MTACPNCSKQFFPIQALLRSLLLPEQRQRASLPRYLLPMLKRSCYVFGLGTHPFSISVDASNHNEVKLFPLVIRFFNAKAGVTVRLLDLRAMPGEASEQIMNFILSSMKENELDLQLLTSFCADNAPVNFGGCNQGRKNNVLYYLTERKTCLIPIGCPAHILHKATEKEAERLTVDIETIVLKIGSHFKSQTSRANSLKQFCEKIDSNYSTLPTHTPTRWLTLDAVLERMIELWEPLKAHFLSLKRLPRILEKFFKSKTSLVIVSCLHSTLQLFKKPLFLLQKTNALFPELAEIIDSFRCKIMQRQSSEFYGTSTADLLKIVNKDCAYVLTSSFQEFYSITLEYISKWYRLERHPKYINWALLKVQAIEYEEVRELAKQVDPMMVTKDELFNKVSAINALLKKIPSDDFRKNDAKTNCMKIFNGNDFFPLLYKLVSIVFSLPVSNALVKRVFSLVLAQWTDERNRLHVNTIKSMLQVKVNLDHSCSQIHEVILKNNQLMEKIVFGKKYSEK